MAVLTFDDASEDKAFANLGKGLQSMLITDLSALEGVVVVERARLKDITAELALSQTAAVDPKTAMKLGKLAGASHLVAGTLTVAGDRMRIDCRIISVATGKVVTAEQAEGAKKEFFSVQRTLVEKLFVRAKITRQQQLDALGPARSPDFEAFVAFSDGVALFDEKKYRAALDALEKARRRDPGFEQAQLSFGEYSRVVEALTSRAALIEAAERNAAIAERAKASSEEQARLAKLWSAAKNGKRPIDRAQALYRLAIAYDDSAPNGFEELHAQTDRFALARTHDLIVKEYWSLSRELFPAVPLLPSPDLPEPLAPTKDKENALERLFETVKSGEVALQLDLLGRAAFADALYDASMALQPSDEWRFFFLFNEVGNRFQAALAFGEATRRYERAARLSSDPEVLKKIASVIALNGAGQASLEKAEAAQVFREYMTFDLDAALVSQQTLDAALADWGTVVPRDPMVRRDLLASRRRLAGNCYNGVNRDAPLRDYLLVSGRPAWFFGSLNVTTGPRSDRYRADLLHYYRHARDAEGTLIVLDGTQKSDVSLGFDLQRAPAPDFWPGVVDWNAKTLAEAGFRTTDPSVTVVFGLTDLDVAAQYGAPNRPVKGFGVRLDKNAVALVEMTEGRRTMRCERSLADRTLETRPLSRWAGAGRVEVRVVGTKVTVSLGGESVELTLPAATRGFYGIAARGPGYASMSGFNAP